MKRCYVLLAAVAALIAICVCPAATHAQTATKETADAIAAYTKAAENSPNPGLAYFNICATAYNRGDMDAALKACDKALSFDPNRADAYFVKGSVLFSRGKLDKQGRFIAEPGTAETLLKYLDLAPNGSHAKDVREMLEMIGVRTTSAAPSTK